MLPFEIRKIIEDKLLSDIKGCLLEEIVLYQTSLANKETFKIAFPLGEIDMVTLDTNKKSSNVFEIKYSSTIDKRQYAHLVNEDFVSVIEKAYYPIDKKIVLYKGQNSVIDDVIYLNVEEYLKSI